MANPAALGAQFHDDQVLANFEAQWTQAATELRLSIQAGDTALAMRSLTRLETLKDNMLEQLQMVPALWNMVEQLQGQLRSCSRPSSNTGTSPRARW